MISDVDDVISVGYDVKIFVVIFYICVVCFIVVGEGV